MLLSGRLAVEDKVGAACCATAWAYEGERRLQISILAANFGRAVIIGIGCAWGGKLDLRLVLLLVADQCID